jgi:hypothetical protein
MNKLFFLFLVSTLFITGCEKIIAPVTSNGNIDTINYLYHNSGVVDSAIGNTGGFIGLGAWKLDLNYDSIVFNYYLKTNSVTNSA